ncbi:MAG TPA: cell wall-binding repeat-containing protein [Candidatus Corynebacterium gallistercoris]|uniref:Cell wall-binding repeat-containing protein n=1 Tax=Candidatus Corynebacterium gallistercoris TaxID=2838530 RepID=A0A9D1RYS4_9CORY|nr:cell wall-binding repeat-containing protein [Candidatus Corynebacterium gallistercoris]
MSSHLPRHQLTRRTLFKASFAAGGALVSLGVLAACSDSEDQAERLDKDSPTKAAKVEDGSVFGDDATGIPTITALFAASESLVLAPAADDQALALAADHNVPVVQVPADAGEDFDARLSEVIDHLGATHLVLVGGVAAGAVASEDNITTHETAGEWPSDAPTGKAGNAEPEHALAGPLTSPAASANALAAGFTVLTLPAADPRVTAESIAAAQHEGVMVALNEEFGDSDQLGARREKARTITDEQPGGGGLVFPGRHVIALYGHPSGPALGVMGEQDAQAAVERAKEQAAQYDDLVPDPVIPAFEIIATVAAQEPGPDGSYTNYTDPAEIEPWVKAITSAGGYAIIDVQPGMETLLTQVKFYEDLIKLPNVGVALDPEWRLEPGQVPLSQVGHVQAAEINEVVEWLDELVEREKMPQKLLMVHQFQLQMIRDREQMSSGTDNVKVLVHCDGHGAPGTKMETWNVVRQDLPPEVALGWKNFIDEDEPMFTPQQTMDVEPTPDFVSYQ